MLIDELIKDEKKNNRSLYSSGPYWDYKNSRAILEIKKKGIQDFRGLTAGIGTSFSDNEVLDVRNEYNIKGRIIGKIFSLPLLNIIFNSQLKLTKSYIQSFLLNKSIVYENDSFVAIVPFASLSPYHTWIVPRKHQASFRECVDLKDLADIMTNVCHMSFHALENPDYNFILQTIELLP
mgnify:CR=1 FL=1